MAMVSYRKQRVADLRRKILLGNHCAGYVVQQRAKSLAPVDTGLLRASITFEVSPNQVDIGVHAGEHPGHHGADTAYFCYQELGTRRNRAQPYLVPGLQQSRSAIEKCYSGASPRGRLGGIAGSPTDKSIGLRKPQRRLR